MSVELTVLAWACVFAVVQIFVTAQVATRERGLGWNISSRESPPPEPSPLLGRMMRAQANFFETFPIAVAALLLVEVAGLSNGLTTAGAMTWLGARLVYWPVYAIGISGLRSAVFFVSIGGLGMVLWPALV